MTTAAMAVSDARNPAFESVGDRSRRADARPTKDLSWELANHAKAYLEARQYANGFTFLTSLLAAGTSITVPAKPHAGLLAPAAQLALAATLVAYPAVTTKARSADATKGADAALQYLRCVRNVTQGPTYKRIRKAFSFPDERSRRRPPGHRSNATTPSPGAGGDVERLDSVAATTQSIWFRADDFWHIVGWAFNCSAVYPKRWVRWKLWLQVMFDFLEADWEWRARQAKGNGVNSAKLLQDSLLWQFLSSEDPTNRSSRLRVINALLATASPLSMQQYPEVWSDETAGPNPRGDDQKPVPNVDFDNGERGDYGDDDEDAIMQYAAQMATPARKASSTVHTDVQDRPAVTVSDAVNRLGGVDGIQLRQRLVALLVEVAQELPTYFTHLESFCDDFTRELGYLPTSMLSILITTSRLSAIHQVALNGNLLLPITAPALPNYFKIWPEQAHFEKLLLPLRGTSQSYAVNAKVSLILEQMLLYMFDAGFLQATDGLRVALEAGVDARQGVYGTAKGKKGNADEERQGEALLRTSSERLLGLLEIVEAFAGTKPQPRNNTNKPVSTFASFGSSLSSAPESESGNGD